MGEVGILGMRTFPGGEIVPFLESTPGKVKSLINQKNQKIN